MLVFGAINVDVTYAVANLPKPGETVWSDRVRVEPGGRGAIQAIAAARDGARVRLVAAVGRDVLADVALAGLHEEGVEVQVARTDAQTGRAAVTVDPAGYTTIVAASGANRLAAASQVPDEWLGPGSTLLLQLEASLDETQSLLDRARRLGAYIVLHATPPAPIAAASLRQANLLLGNEEELSWLGRHLGSGHNPASLRSALGVDVVRLRSVQGVEAAWAEGYLRVNALKVHMRDTTGAADCFAGVLAAALERGATLPDALRRASTAAALSTTRLGALAGLPDTAAIDAALYGAPQPSRTQLQIAD